VHAYKSPALLDLLWLGGAHLLRFVKESILRECTGPGLGALKDRTVLAASCIGIGGPRRERGHFCFPWTQVLVLWAYRGNWSFCLLQVLEDWIGLVVVGDSDQLGEAGRGDAE
jgi:hypothetical protein